MNQSVDVGNDPSNIFGLRHWPNSLQIELGQSGEFGTYLTKSIFREFNLYCTTKLFTISNSTSTVSWSVDKTRNCHLHWKFIESRINENVKSSSVEECEMFDYEATILRSNYLDQFR